jgi:hypothetical protein
MPKAPYTGPETTLSLGILEALVPGMPTPTLLLGGWGVYFTVNERWSKATGQDYFGSRDIDLGFHTPPKADARTLREGNIKAAMDHLLKSGFHKHGAYQVLRYHAFEDDRILTKEQAAKMSSFDVFGIAVDMIASHERPDLREVMGFQAFSEPLLALPFEHDEHRVVRKIAGHDVWLPAPHVLVATKLNSLPGRQKDDKSEKDLCDLYALILYSGVTIADLRNRLHAIVPDARNKVDAAMDSTFIDSAAAYLAIEPDVLRGAIRQMR